MSKLFSAYLMRLKMSRLFWSFFLVMTGSAVLIPVIAQAEMHSYGIAYTCDSRLAWHTMFTGVTSAIFTAWFLGTEYSDGTIRNKLIAGHSRSSVYMLSLGICVIAQMGMLVAHMFLLSVLGQWFITPFRMEIKELVLFYTLSLLTGITFTSLFTMLVMQTRGRSDAVLVCILTAAVLFAVSFYIMAKLAQPEMTPPGYLFTEQGWEEVQSEPNPAYLKEPVRSVFQWVQDIIPFGQSLQLGRIELERGVRMIFCNLAVTACTTLAGLWRFSRRDLA